MHWATTFLLSAPLWLSWLGSGTAGTLPKATLARRQPNPPGGFVYRGDQRSPQEIRGAGGFRPQGEGWEHDESSYSMDRHFHSGPNGCGLDESDEPNFVFRTAYVSMALPRSTAEMYGDWLYEIRATPNMLDDDLADGEVLALGGAHWRQVRRFTRMRDGTDDRVDESTWVDNPEFDAELYERSENARHCRVTTEFPAILQDGTPDASDSDSDMDSDDDDAGTSQRRPAFAAVDRFMDRTEGVYELYGGFPPRFAEYQPRSDIPGPSSAPDAVSVEQQVANTLQRFNTIGADRLTELFPEGSQYVREALGELDLGACPAWIETFGSGTSKRSPAGRPVGRSKRQAKPDSCCKVFAKLSRSIHKHRLPSDSEPAQSFGLSLDELQRVRSSNFQGLNCTAIVIKIQDWTFGLGSGSAQNNPSQTQDDCRLAQNMVTTKPRKSGKLPDQSPPQEPQLPLPKPANVVFFGHYLWPEEARKQGGFLPQLTKPPGPEYITDGAPPTGPDAEKIDIEWATFLVPAYLTFGAAAMTAADAASRNTGFPGVVYAVHATPNMVSLGNRAAVVGGIRWSQVLGWMQVPQDYSPPDMQPHERANMKEHFHKAFQASTSLFSPNSDYDHSFDGYVTTVDVPQQFGAMDDLVAFMNQHGHAVGWTGTFPLFEAAEVISAEVSRAAKTSNSVAAPHEASFWDKVWGWTKAHALALALLPAVAVLNLIPGLGEAADAAEVAALCAEGVESIELVESASTLQSVGKGLSELLNGVSKLKID